MSPVEARIFSVENDQDFFNTQRETLQNAGHKVVLTASTRTEVTEKLPLLRSLRVQVAIVDGNLRQGDASGFDGEAVAKEIKELAPEIVVVGNALRNPIVNADINCPKIEGIAKMSRVITEI